MICNAGDSFPAAHMNIVPDGSPTEPGARPASPSSPNLDEAAALACDPASTRLARRWFHPEPCWTSRRGAVVSTTAQPAPAARRGHQRRLRLSRFVPPHSPAVLRRPGSFRWVALRRSAGHLPPDEAILAVPEDEQLGPLIRMSNAVVSSGAAARLLAGYGERARAGLAFNDLMRPAKPAPIVIGAIT